MSGVPIPGVDINDVLYNMPYGLGLWQSLAAWPSVMQGRANTIVSFFDFSCAGDWYIYLETLVPPVGDLFIALFSFGWDDVARGFFRPTGLRNRWKFRGAGGKQRRPKFEIPEIGELIGEHLPGAKWVKGIKLATPLRWLWKIDGIAQRVLWYWLVVDLAADFVASWTTGLFTARACWESDGGWRFGGKGAQSWPANGQAYDLGMPQPVVTGGAQPPAAWPLHVGPGDSFECFYSLDGFQPIFRKVESVGMWFESDSGQILYDGGLFSRSAVDDFVPTMYRRFVNNGSVGVWIRPRAVAYASGADTAFFGECVSAVRVTPASVSAPTP